VQSSLSQNEGSRLESLRSFRILRTSPERAFDDIACLAAHMCDAPLAVIAFVDEQTVWFKSRIGVELDEIPRDGSFCDYAVLQPDVLVAPEGPSDERFMSSFLVKHLGVRFYVGVPLIADNAYPLGVLAVMDRVPHLVTAEQSDFLRILSRRTMREIELPRTREARSSHERHNLGLPSHRPATILIVEENDNLRNLLYRVLEANGFSVFHAADGTEALSVCQKYNDAIDLVLSDGAVPRVNGCELSDQIRTARPETKFLFITDFGDRFAGLHEPTSYGANTLEKPFLCSELLRKVEDAINGGTIATRNVSLGSAQNLTGPPAG
jgi:CheY-like chemotaxis protein